MTLSWPRPCRSASALPPALAERVARNVALGARGVALALPDASAGGPDGFEAEVRERVRRQLDAPNAVLWRVAAAEDEAQLRYGHVRGVFDLLTRSGASLDPVLTRLDAAHVWPWTRVERVLLDAARVALDFPAPRFEPRWKRDWAALEARLFAAGGCPHAPLVALPAHLAVVRALLAHREGGAALLKVHLDLAALAAGGAGGDFVWTLPGALDRLGYTRAEGAGFDARTRRAVLDRLARLGTPDLATPGEVLWHLAPLGKTGFVVRPGAWWTPDDGAAGTRPTPRALFALPVDGAGRETQRLALRLAPALAARELAARRHGRAVATVRLAALLREAGLDAGARGAHDLKRWRAYLAGRDGLGGAFGVLRAAGGFDLGVLDEPLFWASGRGWPERFGEARVRLAVPD